MWARGPPPRRAGGRPSAYRFPGSVRRAWGRRQDPGPGGCEAAGPRCAPRARHGRGPHGPRPGNPLKNIVFPSLCASCACADPRLPPACACVYSSPSRRTPADAAARTPRTGYCGRRRRSDRPFRTGFSRWLGEGRVLSQAPVFQEFLESIYFFNLQSPSLDGEFDPGSGRTLAARLTHASRAVKAPSGVHRAANGRVTRGQPAPLPGIAGGNPG